jgi:hypothetical protein
MTGIMQKKILVILILSMINGASACWGFTITEPKTGAIFHPGNTIVIKAKADAGENIKMVFLGAIKQNKGAAVFLPPYELSFAIDPDFIGTDTILASARLDDGRVIESNVQITVVLPPDVLLKSIDVEPKIIFLYKLPPGSDLNKVRIFETKSLSVGGTYTDGIEREITSSISGTTYANSDEKVVAVNSEGKMTAKSTGTAKITVKNGNLSAEVKVVVKPYKK